MLDGVGPVKVLATYSIKGGVGKTTAAVNLGVRGRPLGRPRAAVGPRPAGRGDVLRARQAVASRAAPSGSVSKHGELADHVRATDVAGVDVLPADFSLRHLDLHLDDATPDRLGALLAPLGRRYDVALLDCRAGHHADERGRVRRRRRLLVPTIPSTLSARTLEQLDRFLARIDDPPSCCRSCR